MFFEINLPVQEIIELTIQAIFLFLLLALVGLIVLIGVKVYIDLFLFSIDQRRKWWQAQLIAVAGSHTPLEMDTLGESREMIALAQAFAEMEHEEELAFADACALVQQTGVDERLALAFRRSWFRFRKVQFLSLLSELPCSRVVDFYRETLSRSQDEELLNYGLYAYSKSVSDGEEFASFIRFLHRFDMKIRVGRNYCKFLIFMALRHLTNRELETGCLWISEQAPDLRMVRCFTDAIGRLEDPGKEAHLLCLYRRFQVESEVVAGVVRSLVKSHIHNAAIFSEVVAREELPIRIAVSKVGLDLCPTPLKGLEKAVRYFFDSNSYVRQNIFNSCVGHNILREQIIEAAKRYREELHTDRFFLDMMADYPLIGAKR